MSGAGQFVRPSTTMIDGVGLFERNLGLAENLRRDEIFVFGKNAAGIDDAQVVPAPLGFTVKPVAGDAGFVSNNGAARAHQPVKQRGFADVGAADDGDSGNAGRTDSEFKVGLVIDLRLRLRRCL